MDKNILCHDLNTVETIKYIVGFGCHAIGFSDIIFHLLSSSLKAPFHNMFLAVPEWFLSNDLFFTVQNGDNSPCYK